MQNHASPWCQFAAGIAFGTIAFGIDIPPGLVAARPAFGQTPATDDHDTSDVFTFGNANSRMTVGVEIGSSGPYPFIIDTGSTRTVIAKELADQLNLQEGPIAKIHSMSNMEAVRTVMIPSLEINGRTVKSIAAPALANSNIGAAGIVGLDALKSQQVVVDFLADTMTIKSSVRPPDEWRGDVIVVTARSHLGQLVLADADADGERVYVIIDTGGEVSLGNEALRDKLARSKKARPWTKIALLSATGGTTTADYTTVDGLRIAGMHILNLPVAFADAHPFQALDLTKRPALLLGMDALRLFDRITVDFDKRKVWFMRLRETAH
jgi:predicted aspartyl protease